VRLLAALLVWLLGTTAHAQDEHRLEWSDDWARVHPAAYAAAGIAFGGGLIFDHFFDPGPEGLVRGPAAFDAPWRERLMADAEEDRERAATMSDVLLGVLLAWPFVDSLVVAGLGDLNSDVAWQLTAIGMEAYAADFLLNTIFKQFVARQRPHAARCSMQDRLENPARCGMRGRLRSFYSGHASAAFNSAGVVCITHLHVPLYGRRSLDMLACGAALLTASVTGVLRIIADRHFASDVVIGALFGLATGALLPYALHYAWDPTPEPAAMTAPLTSSPVFSYGAPF
jgi:membrane-associated phospholipid phosphatase